MKKTYIRYSRKLISMRIGPNKRPLRWSFLVPNRLHLVTVKMSRLRLQLMKNLKINRT